MKKIFLGFLLLASIVQAAPYFNITKSATVVFPANILVNAQGVGDYVVTNVSGATRNVYVRNLPNGFSQATADTSSCGATSPFSLANGASCTLRLAYISATATRVSTQLPMVCPTADSTIGCITPTAVTTFNVVSTPTSDMTTLSSTVTQSVFAPGQTSYLSVTNSGNSLANNVRIVLPTDLAQYLGAGAVTSCSTLAPGATCTFVFPMLSSLPLSTPAGTASVQASNAPALSFSTNVQSSLIAATALTFSAPGTQKMTLTNFGVAVTNMSMDFPTLTGITADPGATTCGTTLGAGASCVYAYTADVTAYGSGTATISFTTGSTPGSSTATVSVDNTQVAINPNGSGISEPIVADVPGAGSFTIENTGAFDWYAPSVQVTGLTWLAITPECADPVTTGQSCTVTYTAYDATGDYTPTTIQVSGTNLSATTQNFERSGAISIVADNNSADQHIGYQAILVTNNTSSTQTLSSISATPTSPASNYVALCNSTGSNCLNEYITDCQNGLTLDAGDSCHFWYAALPSNTLVANTTTASFALSFDAAASSNKNNLKTFSITVNLTYGNDLYVGGNFTAAGGVTASNLAAYDGTNWYNVGSGTSGTVYALANVNGDLYVGGSFSTAGSPALNVNNIAWWNGSTWSELEDGNLFSFGIPGGTVYALAVDNSQNLYVGGSFSSITGVSSLTVNNIAEWDGSNWSALGTSPGTDGAINALARNSSSGNLYVGGSFTYLGDATTTVNNVAEWNGSSWSGLGTNPGTDGAVNALLFDNSNNLYVGGSFTYLGDATTTVNNVAEWNGSSWSGLNIPPGVTGTDAAVNSFSNITDGDGLGVFGVFSGLGGFGSVNNAIAWDGSSWAEFGIPNGVSGPIYASVSIGSNGNFYIGGSFTYLSDDTTIVNNITEWNSDEEQWLAIGNGITGTNAAVKVFLIMPQLTLSISAPTVTEH